MIHLCEECGQARIVSPNKRRATPIPTGWKKDPSDRLLCDKCIKSAYVMRAFELPVVKPTDMEWPEFRQLISACWENSTHMANWAVSELAKNDIVRTPAMKNMPKMPPIYLYGLGVRTFDWKSGFWKGATQSVCAVINKAQKVYQKERFAVVWRREASPPCFRYPFPFPVDKDAFSICYEGGRPVVNISLPGGKVSLLLRSGAEFSRQLSLFRMLYNGKAIPSEISISRRGFRGDNPQGFDDRTPGGGSKSSYRIMVKFVARFPRTQKSEAENGMLLRTDPDAFLVAEIPGRSVRPNIFNCDDLPRRVIAHRIRLQRIGEDTKHEKRWDKRKRLSIEEAREKFCDRHNDWMDTFMHTVSKEVAEYAFRQKVSTVGFNTDCKTFVPSFPWHRFESMLKYKLDARGIALVSEKSVIDEPQLEGV